MSAAVHVLRLESVLKLKSVGGEFEVLSLICKLG